MRTVSVHEAKTHLSRLLRQVSEGKQIIITNNGKPVAVLGAAPKKKKRISGDMRGKITRKPGHDTVLNAKQWDTWLNDPDDPLNWK